MTTHRTLTDHNLADERSQAHSHPSVTAANPDQLQSQRSARSSPDQAESGSIPAPPTAKPPPQDRKRAGSAVGMVAIRLLTVLMAAMVVTSIIGLTTFDRGGGNSTTAVTSLAIGGYAAVLGMTVGFMVAYRAA